MKEIFVKNLIDLENWLKENYNNSESVWLVHYKFSSGFTDLNRKDLVDLLLCYGWIDSLPGKISETKTKILISPRNPKSSWSKINKDSVLRLLKEGKMKKSGIEVVKLAKENGSWNRLNEVDKLTVPEDMKEYMEKHELFHLWDKVSASKKRGILESLLNRKSEDSRDKYLKDIFESLKF